MGSEAVAGWLCNSPRLQQSCLAPKNSLKKKKTKMGKTFGVVQCRLRNTDFCPFSQILNVLLRGLSLWAPGWGDGGLRWDVIFMQTWRIE